MPGGNLGQCIIPLVLGAVVTGIDGVHVSPEGELRVVERELVLIGNMHTEFKPRPFFEVLSRLLFEQAVAGELRYRG